MNVEVFLKPDPAHPDEGTIYLVLRVEQTSHHWNNLAAPPEVTFTEMSGLSLAKATLLGGDHPGEGDKENRVLVVRYKKTADGPVVLTAETVTWICHDTEGWCRRISAKLTITGKI